MSKQQRQCNVIQHAHACARHWLHSRPACRPQTGAARSGAGPSPAGLPCKIPQLVKVLLPQPVWHLPKACTLDLPCTASRAATYVQATLVACSSTACLQMHKCSYRILLSLAHAKLLGPGTWETSSEGTSRLTCAACRWVSLSRPFWWATCPSMACVQNALLLHRCLLPPGS